MKIKFTPNINVFNKYKNNKDYNYFCLKNSFERSPSNDCISFSGKTDEINHILNNKNTMISVKFIKKIVNKIDRGEILNSYIVKKSINEFYPTVNLNKMSELKNFGVNPVNCKAYSYFDVNNDFKKSNITMFVDFPKDKKEMLEILSDCAHEFTHVSQCFNNNEDITLLKKASKNDPSVLGTLINYFEYTFDVINANHKNYATIFEDKNAKKLINSDISDITKDFLRYIYKNKKEVNNITKVYTNLDDMAIDSASYCAIKAKAEKEAYASEYAINKALNRDNNQYFYAASFYANLENILK